LREGAVMNYLKGGVTVSGFNDIPQPSSSSQTYDLLFKLVKTDAKLIRSLLESNSFS
jgi:hypothetical protein